MSRLDSSSAVSEAAEVSFEEDRRRNEALARQINREARTNPHSPYKGKYVGIVRGVEIVVGDTLDEVADQLRQMEPDLERCFVIIADADYEKAYVV
jgi:hypothetical protein